MAHNDATLMENSGEHVAYELGMLIRVAELFPTFAPGVPPLGVLGPTTDLLRNMAIESFGTHLRNLIAFLFYPPTQKNALTAEDFVRDVDAWRTARGDMAPVLARARNRVDRELSHLTVARFAGTPPEKAWNPHEIFAALLPVLRTFREHASAQRLHPLVHQLIDQIEVSS